MKAEDRYKQMAGEKAASFVQEGMIVGLGSGSTMYWMVRKLGEMVQKGLTIAGIPTSLQTEKWAKEFGVPLTSFAQNPDIDLAIDGADEIDPEFRLIKGGGGSLVREKVVAAAAKQFIIAADESKVVSVLGHFPLPVEIVPFGFEATALQLGKLGCDPQVRTKGNEKFVTDNGNFILDCSFSRIEDPVSLHHKIKMLTGVVETGLFLNMADVVIIGDQRGAQRMNMRRGQR
ncbi:ribose-5-phosphate isomerase RpiA [Jeotgalibacillus campisalis]|uniref:Ribose-5-phosphate isomerase A n=1 Tax=Jeotgalibacillus campisalis TaxID=220754 RepID=A0A0C2W2T4_9BACL|nr:ribose-5-phosphate isomerase RpiA [Jeotgalibacillus campisalis]KIL50931.1 ribose-5-phosphate isomerase [Jeotgalibacillus campisalis]